MLQATPSSGSRTATSAPPADDAGATANGATESVTRPDPGLARGKWEAPAWAFWVVMGVALVAAALYVLRRMGILRFARPSKKPSE